MAVVHAGSTEDAANRFNGPYVPMNPLPEIVTNIEEGGEDLFVYQVHGEIGTTYNAPPDELPESITVSLEVSGNGTRGVDYDLYWHKNRLVRTSTRPLRK